MALKSIRFENSVCLHKYLIFLNLQLMSALASFFVLHFEELSSFNTVHQCYMTLGGENMKNYPDQNVRPFV